MRTLSAPAKVNLYLHVTGKREDGYHLLESMMCFADICDEVTVTPSDKITITADGEFASLVPTDSSNIAYKAAEKLQPFCGNKGADIHITKNLPVGAGIGGGSADAAAVLHLLNEIWEVKLSDNRLAEIGLSLGADVPICLNRKAALVSGIGENICNIATMPEIYIVLVNPKQHVATPQIFKMGFEKFTNYGVNDNFPKEASSVLEYLARQHNDLMPNAVKILPVIGDILAIIKNTSGCVFSRMSGSGATCFGIFENRHDSQNASDLIKKLHPNWWVKSGIIQNY